MVDLASVSGRSLVPDLSQSLSAALNIFGTPEIREERQRVIDVRESETERQRQIQIQMEKLLPAPGADPAKRRATEEAALIRLGFLDPELARVTKETMAAGDVEAQNVLRVAAERGARNAAFINQQPDFAAKKRAINVLAGDATARGESIDKFIELQNMDEDTLGLALQKMEIAARDIKDVLKPPAPQTFIAKARADLNAGLLTEAEFKAISSTPPKFQSKVGKLIGDRQLAVIASGSDSAEVAAIDATLKSLINGKTITPKFETFTTVEGNVLDIDIKSPDGASLAAQIVEAGGRSGDPKDPKITAPERKAAGFAVRLDSSSLILDELQEEFSEVSAAAGELLPNFAKSPSRQRFEQASRNFINAVLRNESGAAIAESEFVSAEKQYIPQPGDSAAVLEQKKENRDLVGSSFRAAAGGALTPTVAPTATPIPVPVTIPEAIPEAIQEGQTATNLDTGAVLIFKDGKWQSR